MARYVTQKYLAQTINFLLPFLAKIRVYYYQWGNIPYFLFLNFLRLIFGCVQLITWQFYGVQNHLSWIHTNLAEPTSIIDFLQTESAQIFNILSACKPSPFDKVRRCFYLTTHKKFCRPDYVLSDHVMLTELTTKKAIFVQLKRTVDHYAVDTHPFLFCTLVDEAVLLIEMPLAIFQKLADNLAQKTPNAWKHVTFLFISGRCGSTVIARMIQEADPEGTLVLSEPPVFMDFVWFKCKMPEEFFRTNLRCALCLFLKPVQNRSRILVKLPFFTQCIAEDFHEIMPKARYLYSHRDPLRVVLSYERAFGASPMCKMLQLIIRFDLWSLAGRFVGFHRYEHVEKAINAHLKATMFDVCLILWSDSFRRYVEQSANFYYPSLSYDHLLENPTDFCRKLLQLMDLSEDRLWAALAALEKDSQEDTILSRKILKHVQMTPYSVDLQQRADNYCDALNLPHLNFDVMKSIPSPKSRFRKITLQQKFCEISRKEDKVASKGDLSKQHIIHKLVHINE